MLHGKKIYKSKSCRSRAHSFLFVQGAQLVLKCPMCQLIVATSPKGSCTNPLLRPGQQSRLPALRLLSALQAHGDLLVTPCERNCLPQPGWKKNPKFCLCFICKGFYDPVAQHQSPAEQGKAFLSVTTITSCDFCHAFKSSDSIHVGFFFW